MSPMMKDNDIDDILESLEELLLEANVQDNKEKSVSLDSQAKSEESKNGDVDSDVEYTSVALKPSRVLLTENMLESNPQEQLPLVEKITSDIVEVSQEMEVPKIYLSPDMEIQPPAFDDAEKQKDKPLQPDSKLSQTFDQQLIEQLFDGVGDDVLSQLRLVLPNMIKSSLQRHLQALLEDGDVKVSEELDKDE